MLTKANKPKVKATEPLASTIFAEFAQAWKRTAPGGFFAVSTQKPKERADTASKVKGGESASAAGKGVNVLSWSF